MIPLIIGAVVAIAGSAIGGAIGAQSQRRSQDVAEDQARIDYERNKTLAVFGFLGESEKQKTVILSILAICVLIVLGLVIFKT